jgi:nudix-type nucleoside diphosphatase (YffH/AdpP family)
VTNQASPRIDATRPLYEGWGRYLLAEIRLPDGGRLSREIEDHGRAVAVLPFDPERRVVLLVRQFRAPACLADGTASVLEVPAGCLDEDDPEACARREAHEEVGLRLGAVEHVGRVWSMPGVSTEQMDLYLAAYTAADRIGTGGGLAEEQENIEVVEMPFDDLARWVDGGENGDMKTLCLVQTLRLRRPELFPSAVAPR